MSQSIGRLSAVSVGIAVALGGTPSAFAQEEAVEEIVVTGSHIRRTEYEGRAPIQIVDANDIALIGASQPAEIIKELSSNSGSQYYNETNNRAGTIMFNIRNLGLGSTLTLLNGRRAGIAPVADDTGTDYVDINQFPLAMIERIEVLTNGASATYGSQAVAGVANIITRKGFEGFELSGGVSTSEIDTYVLNLAAGSQFDRGGFNVYTTWYEQNHQDRSDFSWMHERLAGAGDIRNSRFLSSTGSPGTYRRATLDAQGNATDVASAVNNPDPTCEAAGGVLRTPADTFCRYHFIDQVSVISAENRIQTFAEFDWEFNEDLKYYAEASFSHNVIKRADGGATFNTGSANGGGFTIPSDHPFNFFIEDPVNPAALIYVGPAAWDNAVHTAADLRAIARPFGADVNHNDKTQFSRRQFEYVRFMNGVEFDLPGSWFLDASLGYAHATRTTDEPHNYRSDTFQQLVRDGEWNPFGTRLSDPGLVSPKDGTSVAANDIITQNKFDQRSVSTSRTRETVIDAVASGELFEFGGGTVNAAIGAQYRDTSIRSVPDSLSAAGESNEESTEGVVAGSQDIWAIFAEVVAPVNDVAELQFAVRREDYGGSVGSTTDPKVSFEVTANDWLGFRGSWGTSFQAPTVRQTASATSSAFIDDSAAPTGPGGSLVCDPTGGLSNNITVSVQGSPNLQPQTSDNYNLGVLFRTEGGLDISIDYWNFDYTDLIAPGLTAQAIVNLDCSTDGIPNDPRVIRDAGGQLRQVNTEFENIGKVQTDGLDFVARYSMEVGNASLMFDGAATYVANFDVDKQNGSPTFDGVGSRNFSNNFSTMPEIRGHVGATYLLGNHSINLTTRYIDSYLNDQGGNAEVDSMTTVDLQYAIVLPELIGSGDTTLIFGANNLFDEEPPALYTNDANGNRNPIQNPSTGLFDGIDRPGYDDRAGHDIRGRVLYLRFKQDF